MLGGKRSAISYMKPAAAARLAPAVHPVFCNYPGRSTGDTLLVRVARRRTSLTMPTANTCPFCSTVLTEPSCWVYSNEHAVAFLDRFPSAPGHMLVIPRIHVPRISDLPRSTVDAVIDLALRSRAACASPDATIGINDGPAAGQTVPHMHLHIIPRNPGDHLDPRGGVRWVLPDTAAYFTNQS